MRKINLINGEYYHIYNRGVEKRNIFLDEADYFRLVLGMREFNDINPPCKLCRVQEKRGIKSEQDREPIVKFICYSLMPNHYHFLVQQVEDGGISKFMQKLGTGYTMYFNKRYKRNGVLFQGTFKIKHVPDDEYLLHLSRYIHLNALSVKGSSWMSDGVDNKSEARNFLEEYKWHSLPFWIYNKPNLVNLYPRIVLDQFSSKESYADFLLSWVSENLNEIEDIVIE
jgi:putative transposase